MVEAWGRGGGLPSKSELLTPGAFSKSCSSPNNDAAVAVIETRGAAALGAGTVGALLGASATSSSKSVAKWLGLESVEGASDIAFGIVVADTGRLGCVGSANSSLEMSCESF